MHPLSRLSGQSLPESPWGPLTWRSLLARALCYPARLPAIPPWMCLSLGHSTGSSSTSRGTGIILREWEGWVIKNRSGAILGLIWTWCVSVGEKHLYSFFIYLNVCCLCECSVSLFVFLLYQQQNIWILVLVDLELYRTHFISVAHADIYSIICIPALDRLHEWWCAIIKVRSHHVPQEIILLQKKGLIN